MKKYPKFASANVTRRQ